MSDVRGWDPEKQVKRQHEKANTDDIISKSFTPAPDAADTETPTTEVTADSFWDQIGRVYDTVRPSRHGFNRLDVLDYLVEHDGIDAPNQVAAKYDTDQQSVRRWVTQFEDVNLVDTTGTPTAYADIVIDEVNRFGADMYDVTEFEELLYNEVFEDVPTRIADTLNADEAVAEEIADEVERSVDVGTPETNPLEGHVPYEEIADYLNALKGERLKPFLLFHHDHSLQKTDVGELLDVSEHTLANWIQEYRETGLMSTERADYTPTDVGEAIVDMAANQYEQFHQAARRRKQELEADPYINAVETQESN